MSAQIKAVISYCRTMLSSLLKEQGHITFEDIDTEVRNSPFKKLSDEDKTFIIKTLQSNFNITQGKGACVRSDYKPWLQERKKEQSLDDYFWQRLQMYLADESILPPLIISRLDTVTDELLDYSGNPSDPLPWSRRGMVMGHVQSGKTTNYSALICKAADAGYKVIILLAGITNSLRTQTQGRLDEVFIGRKSVFQQAVPETMSIMNYATKKRYPHYGTSRDSDFSKAVTSFGVSLTGLSEPIIFVIKKNKSILKNLKEWIPDIDQGDKVDEPLLLIDDEADNASINTSKDPTKSTAINTEIRGILQLFRRSTYIGYTGTPFANIFIDPNTNNEMIGDDLFPKHFIKALEPPDNYAGATRIFRESGNLFKSMVGIVDDYIDILPLKHKKTDDVVDLPESLYKAIRVYILTRAIRCLRGQGDKHCSMMINVSRFNDIQSSVEGLVYTYLTRVKNSISISSAMGSKAFDDKNIQDLKTDYDEEFGNLDIDFLKILPELHSAATTISVRTVNMRGGKLDYEKHEENGLHVIVIGGLALSRGLTLEGLTVSYILRNASAADTLMQMARWFGYRTGYEDICRLYLPESSYDHYEEITDAIEELRSEIDSMEILGRTPEDFGLKVRQSPTGIRITAANKMRASSQLQLSQDYSGKHIEGHAIFNEKAINDKHASLVKELFCELGNESVKDDGYLLWSSVSGKQVQKLILEFNFTSETTHLYKISNTRSLVDDYISDRIGKDLEFWDIALPVNKKAGADFPEIIPGRTLKFRSFTKGMVQNRTLRITGTKNRVALQGDAAIGMTDDEKELALDYNKHGHRGDSKYCMARKRPLLLVHVFKVGSEDKDEINIIDPAISLSLCFPPTNVKSVERTYHINKVYRDILQKKSDDEADDDEDTILNGDI